MSERTFGELMRERFIIKPDCFGKISYSEKCGQCPVVGSCFNENSQRELKK